MQGADSLALRHGGHIAHTALTGRYCPLYMDMTDRLTTFFACEMILKIIAMGFYTPSVKGKQS